MISGSPLMPAILRSQRDGVFEVAQFIHQTQGLGLITREDPPVRQLTNLLHGKIPSLGYGPDELVVDAVQYALE